MEPFCVVNDGIRQLGRSPLGLYAFVYDCASASCTQVMYLSGSEYDDLREGGKGRFATVEGHERQREGRVVAQTERFLVIESSNEEVLA